LDLLPCEVLNALKRSRDFGRIRLEKASEILEDNQLLQASGEGSGGSGCREERGRHLLGC